jgi:hypothetical protein
MRPPKKTGHPHIPRHCEAPPPVRQSRVMKRSLFSLPSFALLALAGCTAEVTNPNKTHAEMQADIDFCTRQANHKYWMDPVAALLHAYDCLDAKGYKRSRKDFATRVESALGEGPKTPRAPAKPCVVPCGTPH